MSTDATQKPRSRMYEIFYEDLTKVGKLSDEAVLSNHGVQLIGLADDKIQLRFEGDSIKLIAPADTSVQVLGSLTGRALLRYFGSRDVNSLLLALPGLRQHVKEALGLAA